MFNRVPEKVPKVLEKVWEALVQSQVRFNRVVEKVPENVLGGFGAEPGQVQQGSGEGLGGFGVTGFRRGSGEGSGRLWCRVRFNCSEESSGEGVGGLGAEPGQVQQVLEKVRRRSGRLRCRARSGSTGFRRFRRRSGRCWCRARSGSTGFRRRSGRLWCNRVPEKVLAKVPGGFGAEPGEVQQGSERLWCRARWGLTGFAVIWFTETGLWCFQRLASHASERLVRIKRCGCWGYHRSLFNFF